MHAPLWDPILSFLHTFSLKSARVGGPHPPNGCTLPPMGNPGSTTDHEGKSLIKNTLKMAQLKSMGNRTRKGLEAA